MFVLLKSARFLTSRSLILCELDGFARELTAPGPVDLYRPMPRSLALALTPLSAEERVMSVLFIS